jgi:biopolymer transport protein TolQ
MTDPITQAVAVPVGDVANGALQTIAGTKEAMDLSLMSLFWHTDALSKCVTISLVIASIFVLAVIFQKYTMLKSLKARADKFEDVFWSGESLDRLYDRMHQKPADPMAMVFCVGMKEWRRGMKRKPRVGQDGVQLQAGLLRRIERVMNVAISRQMTDAERYMTFLANTGSAAPFVGLFGTVWGILNSFTAIAASNNTSLAVVAPGIAEALMTTAIGLVAAIPAVIAFNNYNTQIGRYGDRLDGFAAEFSSILARFLEESSTDAQVAQPTQQTV